MDNDYDLAKLYPADAEYWLDIEIISGWQAALLSLGIEPRTIHEISCQRDPEDETDVIYYGQQEPEYVRRVAAIHNAIAAKSLMVVDTDNPSFAGYVRLKEFIVWAAGKGWLMPEWVHNAKIKRVITAMSLKPSVRETKKSETQDRYQKWQSKAEQIHTAHPSWTQSKIARTIAKEVGVAPNTVRNKIKIN